MYSLLLLWEDQMILQIEQSICWLHTGKLHTISGSCGNMDTLVEVINKWSHPVLFERCGMFTLHLMECTYLGFKVQSNIVLLWECLYTEVVFIFHRLGIENKNSSVCGIYRTVMERIAK